MLDNDLFTAVDTALATACLSHRVNRVPWRRLKNPARRGPAPARCTEVLRQAAQAAGLLDACDAPGADGIVSEAASTAIEALLARELTIPEPSPEACARHYDAHLAHYRTGERVQVRHILFAVTPGTDVVALRNRAETCLLDVRCHEGSGGGQLRARARSNCRSGERGGDLDWLVQGDCAPEFARELFGQSDVGVLPRLVHSRFGLHVVEVLAREPGMQQPLEAVRGAVTQSRLQQKFCRALRAVPATSWRGSADGACRRCGTRSAATDSAGAMHALPGPEHGR